VPPNILKPKLRRLDDIDAASAHCDDALVHREREGRCQPTGSIHNVVKTLEALGSGSTSDKESAIGGSDKRDVWG
jgi:hypothetical protein